MSKHRLINNSKLNLLMSRFSHGLNVLLEKMDGIARYRQLQEWTNHTRRGLPLSPMQQVLMALRFYATGSYERVIGDLFGVTVSTACTVIHKVSREIAKRKSEFISFPGDVHEVKRKFYDIAGFPWVVGAIDCCHVRTICPDREHAMAFVNRKQYYSINVQAICNSEMFITNIVGRWPGSTHDARIFENSAIAEQFRNGVINGLLVGDSGYACRAYLMSPLLNPRSDERRYNTAHRRTRCVIERCFGVLKRRFPCLHSGMRTALRNTLVIVVAVAALHNFALTQREGDMDDGGDDDDDVPQDPPPDADVSGNARRQLIIARYFA